MEIMDPATFISGLKPGKAFFARWSENGVDYSTSFFIQEDQKHLDQLSKSPQFNFRMGMITYANKISVIPLMFRINNNDELLYMTVLNVHIPENKGWEFLNDFCSQERILFHFYEGRELRRSIGIPNKMKSDFQKIKAEVEKLPGWSMSDFNQAKQWLYRDFSNSTLLYNAFEGDKNFYSFD